MKGGVCVNCADAKDSSLIMVKIASNSKIIEECLGELKDLEKRMICRSTVKAKN